MDQEKPTTEIVEQIQKIIRNNPEQFNNLEYGELKFEIRDGVIYRVLVSSSMLVRAQKGITDEIRISP